MSATAGYTAGPEATDNQTTGPEAAPARVPRRQTVPANVSGFTANDEEADSTAQQAPQQPQQAGRRDLPPAPEGYTEFMRHLTALYGVEQFPDSVIPVLQKFTVDESRPLPQPNDATPVLHGKIGDAEVMVTRRSVTTSSEMTPEVAYALAAAAAANPVLLGGKVNLTGTDEEKSMLLWAAQHFNLEVEQSSIPELKLDDSAYNAFVAKMAKFERDSNIEQKAWATFGLEAPVAAAPEPAPEPAAAAAAATSGRAQQRRDTAADHNVYGHPMAWMPG